MVPNPDTDIEVVDQPTMRRFEIRLDGKLDGTVGYRLEPGRVLFTHTEVDPAFEGQGLGGKLAAGALDAMRERDLKVVPLCPFVAEFIRRHPRYQDLVVES
jgi:predicted GNAT family acetyltransferase